MQKVIFGLMVMVLVVGLVVAGCAKPASTPATEPAPAAAPTAPTTVEQLYEAAKMEGKVTYWGSTDTEFMTEYAKAFNLRYPGIEVEPTLLSGGVAMERAITEAIAGRHVADTISIDPTNVSALLERGLLATGYDWTGIFGLPEQNVAYDGSSVMTYVHVRVILYNTDLVSAADVPKSEWDLLDPKWKGKIILDTRGGYFANMAQVYGEKEIEPLVVGLKEQEPIFVKGGTALLMRVAAGEALVGIHARIGKTLLYQDRGAPIDWVRTKLMYGEPSYIAAMANAPHPNAAKLFTGWFSGPEAQELQERLEYKAVHAPGAPNKIGQIMKEEGIELWNNDTMEKGILQEELQLKIQKLWGVT